MYLPLVQSASQVHLYYVPTSVCKSISRTSELRKGRGNEAFVRLLFNVSPKGRDPKVAFDGRTAGVTPHIRSGAQGQCQRGGCFREVEGAGSRIDDFCKVETTQVSLWVRQMKPPDVGRILPTKIHKTAPNVCMQVHVRKEVH
jgi:hypothetical protein